MRNGKILRKKEPIDDKTETIVIAAATHQRQWKQQAHDIYCPHAVTSTKQTTITRHHERSMQSCCQLTALGCCVVILNLAAPLMRQHPQLHVCMSHAQKHNTFRPLVAYRPERHTAPHASKQTHGTADDSINDRYGREQAHMHQMLCFHSIQSQEHHTRIASSCAFNAQAARTLPATKPQ